MLKFLAAAGDSHFAPLCASSGIASSPRGLVCSCSVPFSLHKFISKLFYSPPSSHVGRLLLLRLRQARLLYEVFIPAFFLPTSLRGQLFLVIQFSQEVLLGHLGQESADFSGERPAGEEFRLGRTKGNVFHALSNCS